LCSDVICMLLSDDALFQQLNPGLYAVCIVSNQQVSGQLIFTPTEVTVAMTSVPGILVFQKISLKYFNHI